MKRKEEDTDTYRTDKDESVMAWNFYLVTYPSRMTPTVLTIPTYY